MSDNATRLAAHPRWEWRPGMVAGWKHHCMADPSRALVSDVVCDRVGVVIEGRPILITPGCDDTLTPDIHHPATKGWMLAMLREATGDPGAHVAQMMPLGKQHGGWAVYSTCPLPATAGATEGEALATALLAAWGVR